MIIKEFQKSKASTSIKPRQDRVLVGTRDFYGYPRDSKDLYKYVFSAYTTLETNFSVAHQIEFTLVQESPDGKKKDFGCKSKLLTSATTRECDELERQVLHSLVRTGVNLHSESVPGLDEWILVEPFSSSGTYSKTNLYWLTIAVTTVLKEVKG